MLNRPITTCFAHSLFPTTLVEELTRCNYNVGMAILDVFNVTASEVLLGLESGRLTSEAVIEAYLAQIDKTNEQLRAVLEIAPTALREAREKDRERSEGINHGALHGLPILIKVRCGPQGMTNGSL